MGNEIDGDRQDFFTRFTSRTAKVLGHAWVFSAAVAILIVWAFTGPLLGFSDTWQLVINTALRVSSGIGLAP
jgi:low affinity Fe/Cu permease